MLKRLIMLAFLAAAALTASAQKNSLPVVTLKDLDGKKVSTADWSNDGKPIVISFWATWCKPCIKELMAIHEQYDEWQKETGVKVIAVTIDDSRNATKVAPFVSGKGWEFEIYLDENSDLKRALNVPNVPHTFLLNGKGDVVWQHTSYNVGDEEELYKQIKEVAAAAAK